MPRPCKAVQVRRIELRLAADDPLLSELTHEAKLRGVELTHHIHDLLRSRYLLRHGQSLQDLLWAPGSSIAQSPPQPATPDLGPEPNPAASAAASAWTELLDTREA